jgi:proline dehydrogenase
MLRSVFISLSHANWIQKAITQWGFARKAALRFVAGETAETAIEAIRQLNARGIHATLDHLGENTISIEAACQAADEVLVMLDAIDRAGVRANVSIKLSQMGLMISPETCRQNLRRMLDRARALDSASHPAEGSFIRIDMEDSTLTEPTLELYFWARQQGYENLGIVIQAYLYRSEADIHKILSVRGKVRLCKGAYKESAEVAFPKKASVDANFDRLTELLLNDAVQTGMAQPDSHGRIPPVAALATHDIQRIHFAKETLLRFGLPKDALEFQMLYGIRRDLQEELAEAGYPVRVYVPYGTAWYPYFMRRLAERPANVWFFISNFFRR